MWSSYLKQGIWYNRTSYFLRWGKERQGTAGELWRSKPLALSSQVLRNEPGDSKWQKCWCADICMIPGGSGGVQASLWKIMVGKSPNLWSKVVAVATGYVWPWSRYWQNTEGNMKKICFEAKLATLCIPTMWNKSRILTICMMLSIKSRFNQWWQFDIFPAA